MSLDTSVSIVAGL